MNPAQKPNRACELVLIGGTGWEQWAALERAAPVEVDTPFDEAPVVLECGRYRRRRIGFLSRHGCDHAVAPHRVNYRANVWAAAQLEPSMVLAINAVGSLNPAMPPAALVLPDQIIDYTWGREHSFVGDLEVPMHVDLTQPFDPGVRERLVAGDRNGALAAGRAVYGVTQGPRLETRAEITRLRKDGCDLVGMTAMPEAALARELGLAYASICVVANWAAGIGDEEPITMDEVTANVEAARAPLLGLLDNVLASLTD